jgi:aminopeptidase
VEAIFGAVLRAGGHPSFHPRCERLMELVLRHGSDEQIQHISPFEAHRLATCNVLIVLIYSLNTRCFSRVDPHKIAMAQAARRELVTHSLQRGAAGEMRYVLTEIPGEAAAQDAHMSLADYEDWVYRAGFLHLSDPIEAWRRLGEQQQRAIDFLKHQRTLRIYSPAQEIVGSSRRHDGTDLTVDIADRTWVNCAAGENFPDGEVFTGPRGVDGVVNFSFPAVYRGHEVDGIRLVFRNGHVVEASATRNEAFLIEMLDQDDGARTAGEIALGTNYELKDFSRNAFFDEKIGGTFHIAVGAGYPQTGNSNQSALHWDLVSDLRPDEATGRPGGTVYADGQVIQRDGKFLFAEWPGNLPDRRL